LAVARRVADPEHKKQLLDIAAAWTMLADEREVQIAKQEKPPRALLL
jgi:hypothetical protein